MNVQAQFEAFTYKATTHLNTVGIVYAILALAYAILWNGQMDRGHREDVDSRRS